MQTHVLQYIQLYYPSIKTAYTALFSVYFLVIFFAMSRTNMIEQAATIELKIWILAASLSLMLAIVAYFLKRLLDSFDKKTEKMMGQLEEHNRHIVHMLSTITFHREKLDRLERKIDRHD